MEPWILVLIMLVLSALFSGLETAFLTSNKLRIELMNKRNIFPAQILSFFTRNPNSFISTLLVGNSISLVVFSIFAGELLRPILHRFIHQEGLVLLSETLIATIIVLVAAEFLPKNLFRLNPNRALNLFAVPLFLVYWILSPIVLITNGLARFIVRFLLGTRFPKNKMVFGKIDLDQFIREGTTPSVRRQDIENEVKLFKRALGFSKVKARECMVPRNEIVAINVDAPIEELKKKFIETRLSKILVYRGSVDNIIGYTHSYEMFKNPESILSILLPVIIAPESMAANDVLTLLLQQHKSVALVVDEFGGTSGMITMEDVIEEIFGEIEDEHDKEEMVEKKISPSQYIFSGRLEIDYINERYKLSLPPSDEYTTLAGLILHLRRSIPRQDEIVVMSPYIFKILTTSDTTVEQVEVRILS